MQIKRCRIKLVKLLGLALCLPIVACGASDVNYITRTNLQHDELYLLNQSDMKEPTNYGAIKFQKLDDAKDEGNLYIIQRKKGVYQAETMVKSDKDKKYYFSVGMDYKNQAPTIGMRIEF